MPSGALAPCIVKGPIKQGFFARMPGFQDENAHRPKGMCHGFDTAECQQSRCVSGVTRPWSQALVVGQENALPEWHAFTKDRSIIQRYSGDFGKLPHNRGALSVSGFTDRNLAGLKCFQKHIISNSPIWTQPKSQRPS